MTLRILFSFAISLPSCSERRNFLPAPAEQSQQRALVIFFFLFFAQKLPFQSPLFSWSQPFPASFPYTARTATLTINNRAAVRKQPDNKFALIGQECCQVTSFPFFIWALCYWWAPASQRQPFFHQPLQGLIAEAGCTKALGVTSALAQSWTNSTCTWQSSGAQKWSMEKGFIIMVMQ